MYSVMCMVDGCVLGSMCCVHGMLLLGVVAAHIRCHLCGEATGTAATPHQLT